MLLKSSTKIYFSIDLKLDFDDGTSKEVRITEDPEVSQYALIEFIRGGNRFRRVCQIYKIGLLSSTIPEAPTYIFDRTTEVLLVIDCAEEFKSCRVTVNTKDIRNIRLITEEYAKELYDEGITEITDDMFDEPEPEDDDTPEVEDLDDPVDDDF